MSEEWKLDDFRVSSKTSLDKYPTRIERGTTTKEEKKALAKLRRQLAKLQDRLYAHGKYSVLICIQGMDTAGKDSLIREVFKDFNARGVVVHSFKAPTIRELRRDYLWRHNVALPERGKFAVFNRSHYENVLITRVYPEYILKERIPHINSLEDITEAFWAQRMEQIRNFERHAALNGTIIFKFFLNLSKEEQRQRLLRRLNEEKHNWKFEPSDLRDRSNWNRFQECYEDMLQQTSTDYAPWYVIPADCKPTARHLVAKLLWDKLKSYEDIREPELDPAILADIDMYRKKLEDQEL